MNNLRTAYLNPATECNLNAVKWSLFLGIFTALSIFLPYTCHQFGLAGVIFLPIHFAVFTAAAVMGLRGGVLVALISPILSYATSGMPPITSLLPMTIELVTYAAVIGLMTKKFKIPMIATLILAMLSGRLVSIILVGLILQNTPLATHFHNIFILGAPGILIQIALVPPITSKVSNFLGKK